jgi:hypothetical protein
LKAYGRDLFAVVKAASGKQPPASSDFDPARVQLELAVNPPKSLAAIAITPFEGALREAVEHQSCIDREFKRNRHELCTLKMQLEPCTEYILDLEASPAVGNSAYPMLRFNFTTSRYADMQAFAADVAGAEVMHRHLANPVALTAFASANPGTPVLAVSDAEFENALRAVRWGDLKRPTTPRVTMIWHGGGGAPPQPFALFIETTEPQWRTRGVPELVLSSPGDPDGIKHYRMVQRPWLDLTESSAGPARVSRFVHSTDGARTLAILKPGVRGGTLKISLRRLPHPLFEGGGATTVALLATVDLTKAPWEDTA